MEVIHQIIDTAKKYGSIQKIVLFGSRARGDNNVTSDYGICVYGANDSDFGHFYLDIDDMDTALKVDITRFEQVITSVLLDQICREGILIYERGGGKTDES